MDSNLDKYNKEILKLLGNAKMGMSITELVNKNFGSRTSIRVALAYLLGQGKINFKQTGMAKVFYIK